MSWINKRPDNWEECLTKAQDDKIGAGWLSDQTYKGIMEIGADAMCKAKDEARRPVKEVRLKLIEVDWGDMSMSEFVDWMYGEV